MSLQQYLNNDVLATTTQTVSGTLTVIPVFPVPMTMAKNGETVIIINKGTGRQYSVQLTQDLTPSNARIDFSSTTFDTPIPEGSIVIQSQETKYTNIFKKNTTFTFPMFVQRLRASTDHARDVFLPNAYNQQLGVTLANGSSVDADFASQKAIFIVPPQGAKVEHIQYSVQTNAPTGSNCDILLFELPIANNTNSSQTITLIDQKSFTSPNDATQNSYQTSKPLHIMAQTTCILPIFRPTGTLSTSSQFDILVSILISYDPRL